MKHPIHFLTTLLLLALLAACAPVETAAPVSNSAAPEEEAAVEEAAASHGGCEEGLRLLEHALGADCVPMDIERVVEMGQLNTELLLAVGYRPVASNTILEQFLRDMFPELDDEISAMTDGLPEYGFPPNLEVLLEADPDIFITHFTAPVFPEDIADTIAPEIGLDLATSWQENMLFVADLIGEREAAEQLIADYDERVAVLQELTPNREEISVSIVRLQPDAFSIQLRDSMGGVIRAEVGLASPEAQRDVTDDLSNPHAGRVMQISLERVDLMDADVILFYGAAPTPEMRAENQALIESLADDPLFQTLNAFRNDQVYLAGDYWDGGGGIISAHAALDDLFRYVADVDPQEVSPNPFLSK
ncbi:MAG: iron-siderophore ABC transporter substrate-binding protein [Chloroflexales bacterium]|nr:iron-siderophore ABC transporter substrate-binding protein [Chloroflexales bacterium]